jgi:DNA-binding LacI/PurR family transcriptional regulator
VQHLIGLGHRRIGYINGPEDWHNSRDRLAGYTDTLANHSIAVDPPLIQAGDWEFESGYSAAGILLDLPERPTAIFAGNDLMALGAIYRIQDAGLAVPGDIAVIGYDNRDFTKIFRPKITTVGLPVYEMGRTAAELLLQQITEGKSEFAELKVKGRLHVRETCGADRALRTKEPPFITTGIRRAWLQTQPED